MKRPEIIGWEVTTNENGVKMATLPRDTMEQIVKYIEYADKQLRLGAVSGECEHPYHSIIGDGEMKPAKCLKCGKYL